MPCVSTKKVSFHAKFYRGEREGRAVNRKRLGIVIAVFAFSVFSLTGTQAGAQESQLTPDMVKFILRCPTPESRQFVDDAFELVRRGKLPQQLLLSSFNYARKKPKNEWFYFEKTLDFECTQVGLNLSALRKGLR